MLFIYLCTTFIQRIIYNLICSDALHVCMRNNVQCTLYDCFVNECDPCILFVYYRFLQRSRILQRIRGASLRQTKSIIQYIHI